MKKGHRRRHREVLARGCGGYQDYWGDFNCVHGYDWTCDYCPIVIEQWKRENHRISLGLPEEQPVSFNVTFDFQWPEEMK